jgi:hypothetical protein
MPTTIPNEYKGCKIDYRYDESFDYWSALVIIPTKPSGVLGFQGPDKEALWEAIRSYLRRNYDEKFKVLKHE